LQHADVGGADDVSEVQTSSVNRIQLSKGDGIRGGGLVSYIYRSLAPSLPSFRSPGSIPYTHPKTHFDPEDGGSRYLRNVEHYSYRHDVNIKKRINIYN
jgi:hypothetical protein